MRILVIKLSSIGDIVHALPAVAFLRRSLPDARISWVVDGSGYSLLEGSPAIDCLINLRLGAFSRRPASHEARREFFAALSAMRHGPLPRNRNGDSDEKAPPDVGIDFQGLIKSGIIASASGSRTRVGCEDADLRERPSKLFLTGQVKTSHCEHIIDKNIALARSVAEKLGGCTNSDPSTIRSGAAGDDTEVPIKDYEFPIAVSGQDEAYVDRFLEGGGRFAILNPGGGWKTKLWPAESFARIGDWLWTDFGIESLVTYGPGEESLADSVASNSKLGKVRTVPSTLKQYVALARRAALFVGGDTGPLHLAAAMRAPIVGLYGPTSPERNGPFDPGDVTVGRDLWCRADCHRRRCWHWECMDIPVADVQRAIRIRLERASRKHAAASD
ncbi:MAG TPA: glycosyltransferase family 9 protein [Blastocatellia bacterium]|nr:glycosyltransferase family 9 protein [Blastocatellia bacterium]